MTMRALLPNQPAMALRTLLPNLPASTMRTLLLNLLLCWISIAAAPAVAQPLAPAPTPPHAQLRQRLDAQLPLALRFTDSEGRTVALGDAIGDQPVLLALGYYSCPQLCGLLMHGLLEALQRGGLSRADFRIVRVSIDPQDTPAEARARRDADLSYAAFLQDGAEQHASLAAPPLDLRLLTGDSQTIAQLTRTAGFEFERSADAGPDAAAQRFAHPAAVLVVTPQGRVARYLMGVAFDPAEVRLALVDAGGGRIGNLSDRIALLCAHFDPRLGRYSASVMNFVRFMGVALVLLLAGLWWWQQRRPARGAQRAQRPGA